MSKVIRGDIIWSPTNSSQCHNSRKPAQLARAPNRAGAQRRRGEGFHSPNYQALARRGTILGLVLAVLVIAIVYLMVVKPGLWA